MTNEEIEQNAWALLEETRRLQANPLGDSDAYHAAYSTFLRVLVSQVSEETAHLLYEYKRGCEETASSFADRTDETGVRLYWRADGAADALETLVSQVRALKDSLVPVESAST